MQSEAATQAVVSVEPKRRSGFVDFLLRLVREKPLGTAGGIITLLLLLTAIFANYIAPYGMNAIHPADSLSPPSAQYILGTDNLGRDELSRIIYGARVSVVVGFSASAIATLLSVVIGLVSGFIGGKLDMALQRFVDAWMCFPGLILLIIAVTVIGAGLWQIIVVLALQFGISGSRIVRGAVMGIKENMYVDAARAIGAPTGIILLKHILPNIMAPIIILFTTRVPAVIISEASLSFLGLGIPPPMPSWGGMLSSTGRQFMLMAPWLALWPGLALTLVVYGVNMFGDALRDILDPRLRGGIGRYGTTKANKK